MNGPKGSENWGKRVTVDGKEYFRDATKPCQDLVQATIKSFATQKEAVLREQLGELLKRGTLVIHELESQVERNGDEVTLTGGIRLVTREHEYILQVEKERDEALALADARGEALEHNAHWARGAEVREARALPGSKALADLKAREQARGIAMCAEWMPTGKESTSYRLGPEDRDFIRALAYRHHARAAQIKAGG